MKFHNSSNHEKNIKKSINFSDDNTANLVLKLKSIIKILRGPDGCPWDKAQTINSLAEFIVEEVHEAYEAILNGYFDHIKEELGDILSQIFMISQIAEEQSRFTLNDVLKDIIEKLIRRHPHVFKDQNAKNEEEALKYWNNEKQKEKKGRKSKFDGIPSSLPSLLYALKIQRKAAIYGFDWKDNNFEYQLKNIMQKIYEEIEEVQNELDKINLNDINKVGENLNDLSNNKTKIKQYENLENEIGDLLFSVINLSRKLKINPDYALRRSIKKFIKRFNYIENVIKSKNIDIKSLNDKELNKLWIQSKSLK